MPGRIGGLITFAGSLALAVVAFSEQPRDAATIANSGSTNTAAFRITVHRSGNAEYAVMPRGVNRQSQTVRLKLSAALAARLFSDLEAAEPLAGLPSARCVESASFGSTATIAFAGQETPNLNCPDAMNSHVQALRRDMNEAIESFHISPLRRPLTGSREPYQETFQPDEGARPSAVRSPSLSEQFQPVRQMQGALTG